MASVRGNIAARCFFLDQEYPPNDDLPQPQLTNLFNGAASVASHCLQLTELRDRRRAGIGRPCEPRGGWDGDFREAASPWDTPHDSLANQGNG